MSCTVKSQGMPQDPVGGAGMMVHTAAVAEAFIVRLPPHCLLRTAQLLTTVLAVAQMLQAHTIPARLVTAAMVQAHYALLGLYTIVSSYAM